MIQDIPTCLVTEPSVSFLQLLIQEQGMDVGPPQENIQANEGGLVPQFQSLKLWPHGLPFC
jgi:hypothetical protein